MTIDFDKFETIKIRNGHFASWAIWNQGKLPKENVGDLSIFDLEHNPYILEELKAEIVFVGLNISRPIERPLGNFHDSSHKATDYKLRYAINDSLGRGGYMTDIIKDFEEKSSGKMMDYLRNNPEFEKANVRSFIDEIIFIGASSPTIVAIGSDSYKILKRNLGNDFNVLKIPHYAGYISKENYKNKVHESLLCIQK